MSRRLGGSLSLLVGGMLLATACSTAVPPTALPTGSLVSLSPAAGGPESTDPVPVAVPDIRYRTVNLARITVEDLGLKVSISKKQESMDWQPETILSQDPKSGTLVDLGSKIKVTISVLPECDPAYPTVCLEPRGPDIDCEELDVHGFTVLPPDPYRLDKDGDGVGCTRDDR